MRKKLLILLTSACCLPVWAQQDGIAITIDQAIEMALSHNEAIKAHEYEQKVAEYDRKAASGLRLPSVSLSGAYVYMGDNIGVDLNGIKQPIRNGMEIIGNMGIQIPPAIGQIANSALARNWELTIQERQFATFGANATLPIFMGGKVNVANKAAKITEQTTTVQGEVVRNELVSELVERYYGLLVARQARDVRQMVVDAVKVHLDDARKLEATGIIARGERLFVEVKMTEAERDLKGADIQVRTIAAALGNTLNDTENYLPVSTLFVFSDIAPLEYFQDMAERNNPLLRQADLQYELAEQGVSLERSNLLPQVAAMAHYRLADYQVSEAIPQWMVGAGVTFNLFDGLQKENKFSASKQTLKRVETLRSKASKDIGVLVEKIYNEMADLRERVLSADKALEFAKEYLRIQNSSFREGLTTASSLLDAELELASIRIERLNSAYLYDLAFARLLEACGESERFVEYAQGSDSVPVTFEE